MIAKEDRDELTEFFDLRYVKKKDCDDKTKEMDAKYNVSVQDIVALKVQQKINNWLSTAIAGGVIALVIKIFAGG